MADTGMSLDDIIKTNRALKSTMKAKGGKGSGKGAGKGTGKGVAGKGVAGKGVAGKGVAGKGVGKGARSNGVIKAKGANIADGKGRSVISDARFKIIEKNRRKLTDAREKLVEIAKQTDARQKLDKLRATHIRKGNPSRANISRKTNKNGRITLSTNKSLPPVTLAANRTRGIPSLFSNTSVSSTRVIGYRPPPLMGEPRYMNDVAMNYGNDYLSNPPLRRTVSNDYAPAPLPPPPVFNVKSSPYTWVKPSGPLRPPLRSQEIPRSRDYKEVSSSMKTNSHSYRDWTFGSKTRTIVPENSLDNKYYSTRHREIGGKGRLEPPSPKPSRSLAPVPRPKSSSSSHSSGYRIVVSNLQANVTQEDIKELFEDVGELLVSRLVRPGTAEVIYKTLKDATKAVETYHNRQLDGHPMKCLLVNPRPKNNPTGPAVRPGTQYRHRSPSYLQPSLGAVHRALFDD